MALIFLGLGSNLHERKNNLFRTIKRLSTQAISIIKISSIYESYAYETIKVFGISFPLVIKQPNYLNCVLQAETELDPKTLLKTILSIEKDLGRKRIWGIKNLPRIIDIDILFYNDNIINQPMLTIPHPKLHYRDFVLMPLSEIAPDFIHPVYRQTIKQLATQITQKGVSVWPKITTTPSH